MRNLNTLSPRRLPGFPRGTRGRVRLALLALVLLAALAVNTALEGRVVSVPDGDTLVVYTGSGQTRRVRLYGVDCPELAQPFGPEAAETASDLVLFETVSLTSMDEDNYKRLVAVVTLRDGGTLNEALLRQGLAWHYGRFCKAPVCRGWKEREEQARRERLGLWRQKKPEAPWKWRAAHPR